MIQMTPRTKTVTVAACSIPDCDSEAPEGCLGCDIRFCVTHSFEHAARVSTEFRITPLDPFSSQPKAPHAVVLCEECQKTPQALSLINLYMVANDAIKRAGESIMPVLQMRYPRKDEK